MTNQKVEPQKKKILNIIIKIAGYIIVVLSFFYLGRLLLNLDLDHIQISNPILTISSVIIGSLIYGVLMVSIVSLSWKFSLEFFGEQKVNIYKTLSVCGKSNIAKYVPGNVMHFVGRNYLGSKLGLNHIEMALSTILEAGFMVITVIIMVSVMIIFGLIKIPKEIYEQIDPTKLVIIISVLITIVAVLFIVLLITKKELLKKIITVLKRFSIKRFILLFIKIFAIYFVLFSFMAMLFIFFLGVVLNVDIGGTHNLSMVYGIAVLSWLLGYIMPGAPGGLGVRESILVLALSPIYGQDNILIAGLLTRAIFIIGDVVAFVISFIINKIYFDKKEKEENMTQHNTRKVIIDGKETAIVMGHATKKHGTKNPLKNYLLNKFDKRFVSFLQKINPQKVLEIGSGTGHVFQIVKHMFPDCHYTAVDIDESLLEIAKQKGANEIVLSTGEPLSLPYEDSSFDLVLMMEVLEHLYKPEDALKEAKRLCSDHFIASVPNEPLWRVLQMLMLKHLKYGGNTPGHINHWNKKSFGKLISPYFDIKNIVKPFPWIMTNCKLN